MEEKWNSRTELLIGKDNIEKLARAKVIVYGIGGVGSYAVEGLARAGVGNIILVDNDKISSSNLNRQIHATHSSIGKNKVDVMKKRILDINPNAIVDTYNPKSIEGGEWNIIDKSFSYVVDCIDTMSNKIKIIEKANIENVNIISAAGTGNKLDPTMFEVSDIYNTSVCPVCKILRKELRRLGIKKHKVVYSKEISARLGELDENNKKTVASISFVPSVAGLIIAGEIVRDIIHSI